MATSDTRKLERLDELENKVAEAARIIEQLSTRSRKLTETNLRLEEQLSSLRSENEELAKQVEALESRASNGDSVDQKKIINKIDRMIEKFGELQV